jgi:phenylacetic acid degradation operon negative regulatory protein
MVGKGNARDEPELRGVGPALLERPLTARSVIASLLLGRHPPSAPAALLVRWCALFGITETSARVALTRMVQRGELSVDGATYALSGRIRSRQADQDFALDPPLTDWSGRWLLAIAHRGAREADERVALRRELEHQRMVPLRDGVWTRPDNLPLSTSGRSPQCSWWRADALDPADVGSILDAFGLDAREMRTCELLELLSEAMVRLPSADALPDAFVTGAAVAQHLRRDPLLPTELLPTAWRSGELRDAYGDYLVTFSRAVAAWAA